MMSTDDSASEKCARVHSGLKPFFPGERGPNQSVERTLRGAMIRSAWALGDRLATSLRGWP